MLNLLLQGPWSADQLAVNTVASSKPTIPEIEKIVEQTWQEHQARLGSALFDGPMSRLESFASQGDKLILNLSTTSYRNFLGTNLCHAELAEKFGRVALANAIGMSAALLTSDNKLVMGRRNDRVVYYPNRIHPFAGALEPKDVPLVFNGIRRELCEELNTRADDIADLKLLAIIEDIVLIQPEFIFIACTSRTADQLRASLDVAEHSALWICDTSASGFAEQLEKIDPQGRSGDDQFTPVAVGAMCLFGQFRYGPDWANRHIQRFFCKT